AGEHGGAAAVEFKAVKGPRSWRLVVRHRPAPEAPLQVAGPVVHPYLDMTGFGLGEFAGRAGLIDVQETWAGGEHIAASDGRRDGADMPVDRDGLNAGQGTIGAQRPPVHLASQDVDPQQLLPLLVPARA